MNEERLKRILDAEAEAQALYNKAILETNQVPLQAEQKAQAMISDATQMAELEAQELIDSICNPKEIDEIRKQYTDRAIMREKLAEENMEKTVNYVIRILLGEIEIE